MAGSRAISSTAGSSSWRSSVRRSKSSGRIGGTTPRSLLGEFLIRPFFKPELRLQERVVLLRRLKHPVNADLAWFRDQVVQRVNGREIASLDDLVDTLEHSDGEFQVFEFTSRRVGVLDRLKVEAANEEILERYGIQQDRNL